MVQPVFPVKQKSAFQITLYLIPHTLFGILQLDVLNIYQHLFIEMSEKDPFAIKTAQVLPEL